MEIKSIGFGMVPVACLKNGQKLLINKECTNQTLHGKTAIVDNLTEKIIKKTYYKKFDLLIEGGKILKRLTVNASEKLGFLDFTSK